MIAGGRTRIDGGGPEAASRAADQIRIRLLEALGASGVAGRFLVAGG
jgi:hypothetical protein